MMVYDILIVGGGPAGSSAATYLSKNNLKVLVLEKEKFPRPHVGESLIPYCYQKLEELGVLDEIKKFAAYKPGVNFVDSKGKKQSVWCFKNVIKNEAHLSFHCLRAPFDNALLRNAEKHGAEVLEEQTVKDIILDSPDGMVEIETETPLGIKNTFKGKFFLDASGQGSFLGKKLGTRKLFAGLDRTAFFCHWLNNDYDSALKEGLIKIIYLGGEKQGWLWVIPVGPNHLSIGVSLNNSYVKEKKKLFSKNNPKEWQKELYLNEIKEASVLEPILKSSRLEHEVLTIGDFSYYNEKKFGKNYAMIGDAASFLDPIFSSGIYVAFETAGMVSNIVSKNILGNTEEMEKELAKVFKEIEGAYTLIEKFIRLFYTPEIVNFAHIGSSTKMDYEGFLDAYNAFHYLISGDFFTNYKHYSDFLDKISSEKNFKKFLNLTKSMHNELISPETCGENFETIYGHLPPNSK
jgi:flavin-dependent dehydrogenase